MKFQAGFIVKNYRFHYYLISMEFGNFLEFIHFSLITISVNFLDQLVTDICDPVLKDEAPSRNGSMLIVICLRKLE